MARLSSPSRPVAGRLPEWFRAELSALNSNGEPICGTGKLQARTAIKKEIAKYRQGSKEDDDSDDILFVYLIDLDGA